MKRKFICFLAITSLLSCNRHEQKENTITLWSSNASQEIVFSEYFVDKWNEEHSQKLMTQPIPEGQSSEEVIMAAVVGRTTPDIYANMWQGLVEMYAKSGVLVPLDT